ncbi:MAG TPA: hypothetical protein DHV36_17360 [Desulfobacteraceae bacterium]|nr:hypothetical protein [Desulfobacteraceae bacterium]
MKALSIRQPWASMIILGYKPVENRTYKRSYRGPLAIHSSQTWDKDGAAWILDRFPHLKDQVEAARDLRGGIIGTVTMTDCVMNHPSPWFAGPYGFVFTRPTPIDFHPCAGKLNFFDVDFELPVGRVETQMGLFGLPIAEKE